jgi:SAM-dependent methyltransferase
MQGCAACGSRALEPHLSVTRSNGSSLAATTTEYGVASGDLVRCATCGHMQVESFPAALDESYAEVVDDTYLAEEKGQRATAARALELIERRVDRGALLDVGAWVGFVVSEAERRGWDAVGVEPSRFASAFARERFGARVETGTLAHVDLPKCHFDAVVLGDVIEHLPDPGESLDRIAGLLRPGGILYLALPDAGSRVARVLGTRWWSVLPTHVQYFTRASLATLLSRHGYFVERVGTAPKAFTIRYYLDRLEGYSRPVATGAVALAARAGVAERIVWPDFRDRMAVLARLPAE